MTKLPTNEWKLPVQNNNCHIILLTNISSIAGTMYIINNIYPFILHNNNIHSVTPLGIEGNNAVNATTRLAIRLTSTYVYNSTYVYTFEPPMMNVKPAQPGLANQMARKSWFLNLVGRGANLFLLN